MPPIPSFARAVAKCHDEWHHAYDLAKEKGLAAPKALRMAAVAYKLAMPRMESLSAIRAAIACTAQGISLEVFDGRDGSQLLYVAQVAMSTIRSKGLARKKCEPELNVNPNYHLPAG